MNRRDFFASSASMLLPVMIDGFGIKSLSRSSALVDSLLKNAPLANDRVLVVIYLNGGNDGLNTVIPLQYYSDYFKLRQNISIPENKVLTLDGALGAGLHPSMQGMANLYNDGKLGIIHSVSYPNPNLSHYRSSDIWMTAVDTNEYAETGWAGRYLENDHPAYPVNYPNQEAPDPLAIQIGLANSTSLLGDQAPMNISLENIESFYQLMGTNEPLATDDLPCCDAGDLIYHVRQQQALSVGYSAQIKRAGDAGKNLASYPAASAQSDLSEQLKIVARLIHGGLQTKIYFLEMGGFDTHSGQVGTSTLEGAHAMLLGKLSGAIAAFQNDLQLQKTEDWVIGMTFSDFGRRANSNASKGTDHGVAAPMFVFGKGIKRQQVGTVPDLVNDLSPPATSQWDDNQDIKMQIDFRRIYADILNDWFGTTHTTTDSLLFKNFKTTSLFSNVIETVASGAWVDRAIWTAGRLPGTRDYVKINSGHAVTLGQHITVRNIQIESAGDLLILGNYKITLTG